MTHGAPTALGQTPQPLPGIVVQGAVLDSPPRRPTAPAPSGPDTGSPAAEPTAASGASADGGGIAADKVGSSVTVITGAELRAQQVRSVADALRALPGISVGRSGTRSGLTQVRIRGAEANHTLVVIDGIVANAATDGEFDFSDLSADDIERVEVIRGPQSGIYGSAALGGVINVVTRSGKGPLTLQASTEGGSYESHSRSARVSGGSDRLSFALGYGEQIQNGFNISERGTEDDEARLKTFSFKAAAKITENISLDVMLRNMTKSGGRDSDDFTATAPTFQVDYPATFQSQVWLAGMRLRWDTLDGRLTHIVKLNHNATDRQDNDPFFLFRNDSETTTASYLGTHRFATPSFLGAQHALSALIEKQDDSFTPRSDFSDGLERSRDSLSGVGEYRGEFANRLFVTGSIRHDDNSAFEDFTTWRATAALKLPEVNLRPHASVGTGVKYPSLFELFGEIPTIFVGNPNLKPEESLGWDAGVEMTFLGGRASVDVTYFKSNLRNEIAGSGLTAVNLDGESTREGVEIATRWLVSPALTVGLSYTYLDAKRPDDTRAVRRPPHQARGDVTYAFGNGRGLFNLSASYNGEMRDNGFIYVPSFTQTVVTLDDYWLVSAAASWELQPGLEIFGRVENLLDQDYQEVYGFNTPGLAAYAGVRVRLDPAAGPRK